MADNNQIIFKKDAPEAKQAGEHLAQSGGCLDSKAAFQKPHGNRTYVGNDAVSNHLLQGIGSIFQQQAQQEQRSGHSLG